MVVGALVACALGALVLAVAAVRSRQQLRAAVDRERTLSERVEVLERGAHEAREAHEATLAPASLERESEPEPESDPEGVDRDAATRTAEATGLLNEPFVRVSVGTRVCV